MLSPQKAEDLWSCAPTGDRGWASLARLEDGMFRQSDEMVYAQALLHAREPQFFKTTDSRRMAAPCAEWPAPMGLCGNVLVVVGGWFPASLRRLKREVFVRQCQVRAPSTRPLPPLDSRAYCSVAILHSLYYSSSFLLCHKYCIYPHTDCRHNNNTIFQPQQHQHYPTLTCHSTATCRDTPSYSASRYFREFAGFARRTKPSKLQTKGPRG